MYSRQTVTVNCRVMAIVVTDQLNETDKRPQYCNTITLYNIVSEYCTEPERPIRTSAAAVNRVKNKYIICHNADTGYNHYILKTED